MGAYSAPPNPLAGFRGPLRGREGKEGEGWEGERGGRRKGEGRGEGKGRGEGREGEGGRGGRKGGIIPPTDNSWIRPWVQLQSMCGARPGRADICNY